MIDTDKYEGHTEGPWEQYDDGYIIGDELYIARMQWEHKGTLRIERDNMEADAQLIADAPLLLAEVKRLREMMDVLASFHIVKNVEQGFTQREWVELVELVKRGEEE